MDHKPSVVMADREGQFQRCWGCGARRKVARFGPGPWDKNGPWTVPVTILSMREDPTQQELVDELFKQT